MTPVAVVSCKSYDVVCDGVASAVELSGAGALFAGKRVLLKVNLMKGAAPSLAVNTNPQFVGAVVRCVRAHGGQAIVADSSGVLGLTMEAFAASGIAKAVADEGGELVDLDACRPVRKEVDGVILRELYVPDILDDVDVRVTVPKLKTHTLALMTCAIKNQVGILPGGSKCRIHECAATPSRLAHAILDINEAVPFDLAIVDGVLGLSGQGKLTPTEPVALGVVVAGAPLVSVDTVCATLMGLPPEEVLTIRYGAERGMGAAALDAIELAGDDPREVCVPFRRPGFEPKRLRPMARVLYRLRGRSVRPVVDRSQCEKCGRCAEICPTDAIQLKPYASVNRDCIYCFACREACPTGALRLRVRRLLSGSFRKRAAGLDMSRITG